MTLKLPIKKEYFQQILSGEKKVEYRKYCDFYIDRLCELTDKGKFKEWKPISTVLFKNGRNKTSPYAIVEVKRLAFEEWLHETTGEPTGEFTFAIYLGEILESGNIAMTDNKSKDG